MLTGYHPPVPTPSPWQSLSDTVSWTMVDSTPKWTRAVFVLLWLVYFAEHDAPQAHPCCSACQDHLLLKAAQHSGVCLCHISFSRPSVDGHLGCFHIWASENDAAMNMGCMGCRQLFKIKLVAMSASPLDSQSHPRRTSCGGFPAVSREWGKVEISPVGSTKQDPSAWKLWPCLQSPAPSVAREGGASQGAQCTWYRGCMTPELSILRLFSESQAPGISHQDMPLKTTPSAPV